LQTQSLKPRSSACKETNVTFQLLPRSMTCVWDVGSRNEEVNSHEAS
jgi:hypothetical protein